MIPAEDFEEFDILPYMLEAIAFLSRAETSSGCAFVHCNYGVNRSGVVAAAYLMIAEHKPLLQVGYQPDVLMMIDVPCTERLTRRVDRLM